MKPLHIKTPLLVSNKTYFKLEACQPCGSFKIRGIGQLCQELVQTGSKMFVSVSGGNAGIAVAYAGQVLNIPTVVFIPETSHPSYLKKLTEFRAQIIQGGTNVAELLPKAKAFCEEHGADFIHPYEHPSIWQGHSTIIDELVDEMPEQPDVILVAVGGGGLACGLLEGMHRHGWNKVPLITVETLGADCFYRSVQANQILTLEKISSKATSLGALSVTQKLWDWRKFHEIIPMVVSDEAAEIGSLAFAKEQSVLVELAAGAPLSLVYQDHPLIKDYQHVVVIVCGGVNTSFFRRPTPN